MRLLSHVHWVGFIATEWLPMNPVQRAERVFAQNSSSKLPPAT